jgi:hypothetical protein|tara:strand:- start:97 stop:435 length:339 start_codon:yes stop_codon:yes gene_type:complete
MLLSRLRVVEKLMMMMIVTFTVVASPTSSSSSRDGGEGRGRELDAIRSTKTTFATTSTITTTTGCAHHTGCARHTGCAPQHSKRVSFFVWLFCPWVSEGFVLFLKVSQKIIN